MLEEKSFKTALSISILFHILILLPLSALNVLPKQKVLNDLEVNYFKLSAKNTVLVKDLLKKTSPKDLEKIGLKQRIVLSTDDKIPESKFSRDNKSDYNMLLAKTKRVSYKPNLPKTGLLARDDIKFLPSDTAKSQNPVYLTYRNFLHESLRRYLYDKYSDTTERGEVYLTFILNADGSVKDVQIIDSKSNASQNLKKIVLESLYAASPFPPLPEVLNAPFLSFSVTIHFTEEELR